MIPGLALVIPLCCAPIAAKAAPPLANLSTPAPATETPLPADSTNGALPGLDASNLEFAQSAPPPRGPSPQALPGQADPSQGTDVEILRIEKDLERIHHDPAKRRAFYEQVDQLIEQVRSGNPIPRNLMLQDPPPIRDLTAPHRPTPRVTRAEGRLDLPTPPLPDPSRSLPAVLADFHTSPQPAVTGRSSPSRQWRRDTSPRFSTHIPIIQTPTGGGPLDRHVLAHLLYWARKNGCPPSLALATAWQESRMSLYPPDGTSGEIGIMQILPARAKAEGVNPKSLRNPDVNMWLGTKLLAQYYRQEGSVSRAAMKYVAGPNVFAHRYPTAVRDYIAWYSSSVQSTAVYFKQYIRF